jgi:tRNA dimethylallyltransferase
MSSPLHAIDARPPAIFLMGPTASGKTALACALADAFPVDLVSVDSALVYRGLDIGAAKPDAATRARHPHALIDIRDPAEPYSAARFREDALQAMRGIRAGDRVPLLAGGTGLYFRALQRGLSELPQADPQLRARISGEAQRCGWPALHARLAGRDAAAAARIRPNDAQRIQRALEVIELTERPLSALQRGARMPFPYRVLKLALVPADRQRLRERIALRFDAMLAAGFLDEVRALRARGDLHPDLPALRAVGYRQAWQHLEGQIDAREFRERAVFATNQLAKRQLTWLRAEHDARVLDPDDPHCAPRAAAALRLFLGRPADSRNAMLDARPAAGTVAQTDQ